MAWSAFAKRSEVFIKCIFVNLKDHSAVLKSPHFKLATANNNSKSIPKALPNIHSAQYFSELTQQRRSISKIS